LTALLAFAIAAALICWPVPVMIRVVGAGYETQPTVDVALRLMTLQD
jgi:hypothetical protein